MQLQKISDRLLKLTIDETRSATDSYVELVLLNQEMPVWHQLLHECLGPPAKDAYVEPSAEIQALVDRHGGIRAEQTLFKQDSDDGHVMAMLWPWGDQTRTTLKMWA